MKLYRQPHIILTFPALVILAGLALFRVIDTYTAIAIALIISGALLYWLVRFFARRLNCR